MKENNERLLNKNSARPTTLSQNSDDYSPKIPQLTPSFQYFGLPNLSNRRFISLDIKGVSIETII